MPRTGAASFMNGKEMLLAPFFSFFWQWLILFVRFDCQACCSVAVVVCMSFLHEYEFARVNLCGQTGVKASCEVCEFSKSLIMKCEQPFPCGDVLRGKGGWIRQWRGQVSSLPSCPVWVYTACLYTHVHVSVLSTLSGYILVYPQSDEIWIICVNFCRN